MSVRHGGVDGERRARLIPAVRDLRPTLTPWLIGFGLWTGLALLSAAERVIWLLYRDQPVEIGSILTYSLADWYACGIFVPVLVIATRRWSKSAIPELGLSGFCGETSQITRSSRSRRSASRLTAR